MGKIHVLHAVISLGLLAAACAPAVTEPPASPSLAHTPTAGGMGDMTGSAPSQDFAPPVRGFYNGGEVLFIHTEASDPDVAQMLSAMMGPRVVLVPRLAEVPDSVLASVYVFTNGIEGEGPFGFQPDVFDSVPGEEGYSPLRSVHLVTWKDRVAARELQSVEEVIQAESKGELTIARPGIVVNMPILSWPGGHR